MSNKYVAGGSDVPSDFNLAKATSARLLKDIRKSQEEEKRAEIIEQNPGISEELEFEDDFKKARKNIANMLEISNRAVEEYFAMAVETDSPRAFEVLNNMIKSTVEINKDYVDIHQQKEKRRKTQKEMGNNAGDQAGGATITNNTQNNIVLTQSDLVNMLKNEGIVNDS